MQPVSPTPPAQRAARRGGGEFGFDLGGAVAASRYAMVVVVALFAIGVTVYVIVAERKRGDR